MKDIIRIVVALTIHTIGLVKLKTARTHGAKFRAISWTEAKLARMAR